MILRPYQTEAVSAAKAALIRKNNCLIVGPCACGKTVIFSELIRWLHNAGRRVLVLMDREQLVAQTAAAILKNTGIAPGIACKSVLKKLELDPEIVVASRQSLAPALRNGHSGIKFNAVFVDEVHLMNQKSGQYIRIIRKLTENYPAMRIFGCTATPFRMTGKIHGPDKIFDGIDYHIRSDHLLENGFLAPLKWKVRENDALASLKPTSTGELNEKEHYAVLKNEIFVHQVRTAYDQYCSDRKTVIFALNIAHAELIQAEFSDMKTWIIHSKLTDTETPIREFSEADSGVMINVGILTIGSDIPSISAIILARRTMSTALFFQIVGRGARLYPEKKDCLIIDLCGSALIHGIDPDAPILQLDTTGEKKPKLKICPMCERACGLRTKTCPDCGFQFPVKEPEPQEIEQTAKIGKLVDFEGFQKIDISEVRYFLHLKEGKAPSVRAEFFAGGKLVAKKWFSPGHPHPYPAKIATEFWVKMSGRKPYPKSAKQWVERSAELSRTTIAHVRQSGKYPEIVGFS
jgi:DNA repair protein RadD